MAYTWSVKIFVSGPKREASREGTMIRKSCLLALILITQIHIVTGEDHGTKGDDA